MPLTDTGVAQAREAGRLLKAAGYEFDVAYTSVLKRAIWTLWHGLDEMDRTWLPIINDWRLNERHYGALQGLNKADTARRYGDEQVLIWRRSYDIPPPVLDDDDPRGQHGDLRYAGLAPAQVSTPSSLIPPDSLAGASASSPIKPASPATRACSRRASSPRPRQGRSC